MPFALEVSKLPGERVVGEGVAQLFQLAAQVAPAPAGSMTYRRVRGNWIGPFAVK